MVDLLIKNVLPFTLNGPCDLAVQNGTITDIGKDLDIPAKRTLQGEGRLLTPGFIESHIHLDIALTNDETTPGRPAPYISHYGLNDALEERRAKFTREDIVHRATEAMKRASRHGVTAMRAQCHIDRQVGLSHLEALCEARRICSDFMTLQIVTFPQQGLINHPENRSLFLQAFQKGADIMGGAPNLDRDKNGTTDFRSHIDMVFEIADAAGVDIDVHTDLGLVDRIQVSDLETIYLAEKTIEYEYQGRVTAGHAATLGCLSPEDTSRALNIIRSAGINIVSQPDLYRLGREDKSQTRRGLTRVKELLGTGVNVTLASNNVRDVLRPMGNFDLLEEALILAYGGHMDTVEELNLLLEMITFNAAQALRLEAYGLTAGSKADLVILDCQSASEAIVGQAEKSMVIKDGTLIWENQRSTKSHV